MPANSTTNDAAAAGHAGLIADALRRVPGGMYVGGSWREASDGSTFDVEDPASTERLCDVPDATVVDGAAALDAAAGAQAAWAATEPRVRSELLREVHERLLADREALAVLMTAEMGKPLEQARGEVVYAAEFFRWFAEEAVRIDGRVTVPPLGDHRIEVLRRPVGPTLAITPWNFPLAMGARKIAPAMAAGCTTVLKPAPQTPLSSLALAAICHEAGVSAGVVNVVTTIRAAEVVGGLLTDPRLRKLTFTGSTEVGRVLLRGAADNVLRVSMELGGNAPLIVCDDADLDVAVEGAMLAKMRNMGQACTAANRIFVQRPMFETFTEAFAARIGALTVGPGLDAGVDVGPMIDADAVTKIESMVTDAVDRGATIVNEQASLPERGHFVAPTVLTGVDPKAPMSCSEIFGPVAAIHPFDDDAAVLDMANDTEHGLVGYVFTTNRERSRRFVAGLEVGLVGINRGIVSDPAAPFGGVKQSGVGREGGREGIEEFLEIMCVSEA
ncbi:MAG: NAD-dependent succinate-semialdehyde dehydrogenase [Nitriliruptoraceae bacterium]